MLITIKSILWMCSTLIAVHALHKGKCGSSWWPTGLGTSVVTAVAWVTAVPRV